MKTIHLYAGILSACLLAVSCSDAEKTAEKIADEYNYVIGTQTIGAGYKFTEKPVVVETAERIAEMGSNIIKIALNPVEGDAETASFKNAAPLELAKECPALKTVLDMDFRYVFMWVTVPGVDWSDGMDDAEKRTEYGAIYEFAAYLLDNYRNSGKNFYIGHWEGDWLLLGNYSRTQENIAPERIKGMTDWYNIRQKAVEDARSAVDSDVSVFHYAEVNRVNPAMYHGYDRIVNRILPYIDVDYVSYSSYESTSEEVSGADYAELRDYLFKSLDYIESRMKPKTGIGGKRVFLGEFGYSLPEVGRSAEEQSERAFNTIRAAVEWGCPFALYWEMYDNEGPDKGFWMIDNDNVKQPLYHAYEAFYRHMREVVYSYALKEGKAPDFAYYQKKALEYLEK